MDAVKFLKELNRMCCTHDSCTICPATGFCNYRNRESDKERQELVGIVEKWSKDHPPKTRLQDFFEKYPNAPIEVDGTPIVCCENLGYCDACNAETDCVKCWNKVMEDDE